MAPNRKPVHMKTVIVARAAMWKLVVAVCGLALLAVACGSSGAPSSGTSSSAPASSTPASTPASPSTSPSNGALCADAAALRASLDKLTHVKVGAGTVNEIKADLTDVQANLTAFVAAARGQWDTQTSALTSALTKLQTAVKSLAANPSASAVKGVVSALGNVSTAAQNLLAAVNTRCPAASSSPSA